MNLTHPAYTDRTVDDARAAFDRVCDRENWKNPIDKVLGCSLSEAMFIRYAIEFMAGGGTTVREVRTGTYRFTHPGYYAVIGA